METTGATSRHSEESIYCHVCNKKMDFLTASVSQEKNDSIYMCFGAILQKIFVYGNISAENTAQSHSRNITPRKSARRKFARTISVRC